MEDKSEDLSARWNSVVRRRAFLKGLGVAGALIPTSGLLAAGVKAAGTKDRPLIAVSSLTSGDVAILRFLAAAELIETDLWQQYNELGGADGGNPSYIAALSNLDGDMPQYISDNTDDEESHAAFLNAYLASRGAQQVNLDEFKILPSTKATGARQVRRLTHLQNLVVDTRFYTRYRSSENPDLGADFAQAVNLVNEPAIPLNDNETPPGTDQPVPPVTAPARRMQAIANTAGFHFGYIEQGGASLYSSLALKVRDLEVLRIVISIGGVEVDHFGLWHDKMGNAVAQPLAGVVDPITGIIFPDLNAKNSELSQTNLILPEPTDFLGRAGLPEVSVIRPTSIENAGAVATIKSFTADRLFDGQSPEFFSTVMELAEAADAAQRGF
ncbi:MAG TPA: ferritin-like domain-containing protein [Candidatus Acidoferrum sp.]|nr:ferritin-like domain-containing protein [Candidatus Acidoferrum sp.]